MKNIFQILFLATMAFMGCQSQKENAHEHGNETKADAPADTVKKSIPKEEHALVNGTHFMIKYHAPAVRGRTIWGGLVPYGEVWVTGAHSATSLETDKPFRVNGTNVPAGKYAIFTIPGNEKWTFIINKNWDQHLADDYDAKDDVVRIDITPEIMTSLQERLKYSIIDKGNAEASIDVRWENLKVSLPVKL